MNETEEERAEYRIRDNDGQKGARRNKPQEGRLFSAHQDPFLDSCGPFWGCALSLSRSASALHAQPGIYYSLRAVALAFAAGHLLLAARCRACIRSRAFITRCALSRLHSQPGIYYSLRAVALAFAAGHLLLAARCRACIRSRAFITRCALSRLHSQPGIYYSLRAVALAFAAGHLLLAARCRACIRS